jgi:hypothetical protein
MPAGQTLIASISADRSIAVFERDALADAGSLAGVTVTRSAGSGNTRALQFSMNA